MSEKINLVASFFGLSNEEYEEKLPIVKRIMSGLYNMDLPLDKEELVSIGTEIIKACNNKLQ